MNSHLEECLKEVQNYQEFQFEQARSNMKAVDAKGPKLVLFEGIGFTFEMKSINKKNLDGLECIVLSVKHEMINSGLEYLTEERPVFLSSKNEAKRQQLMKNEKKKIRGRIISEERGTIYILLNATEAEFEEQLDSESYFEFYLGSDEDQALTNFVSNVQQSPEEFKLLLKILAYMKDPESEISAGAKVKLTGKAEDDLVKVLMGAPEVCLVHTLPNSNGFGVLQKYLESQGSVGKKVLVVSEFQETIPNLITQLIKSKPDWVDKMLRLDEPLLLESEELASYEFKNRLYLLRKESEDKNRDFVSEVLEDALFFFSSITSLVNPAFQQFFKAHKFDSCILLNAGQTPFALSLLPIALTNKIILVGDHYIGYPSIKDSVWKKAYDVRIDDIPAYRTSLFERLFAQSLIRAEDGQRSICIAIKDQNFTSQLMVKSSNDHFYQGQIQTQESAKRKKLTDISLFNKGTIVNPEACLLWLDHQNSERMTKDEYANEKEAELVMEVLKDLIINLEIEPGKIAIYSPFVYQSEKIKAYITETFKRNTKEADKIRVYQNLPSSNAPSDIIIFSATRSNSSGECEGIDERSLNNLVTSAKYLFVMVGNKLTLKNLPSFNVPRAKKTFILTLIQNTTLYGEVVVSSLFDRLSKENKRIQYSVSNDGPWIKDLSESIENYNSLQKTSEGKISTMNWRAGLGYSALGSQENARGAGNSRYGQRRSAIDSSDEEDEPLYGKHTTGGAFGVGGHRSLFNQDSRYKRTDLYDELKEMEYKNYRKRLYESHGLQVDQGKKKEFNALEFQGDYDFQFDDETLMKKISQMEEADNKGGKKEQMDEKPGAEDEMTEKPVKEKLGGGMTEKKKEKESNHMQAIPYDDQMDMDYMRRNFINRKYSHLPVEVKQVFLKHLKLLTYNNLDMYPLSMWFDKEEIMAHEDLVGAVIEALSFEEQRNARFI